MWGYNSSEVTTGMVFYKKGYPVRLRLVKYHEQFTKKWSFKGLFYKINWNYLPKQAIKDHTAITKYIYEVCYSFMRYPKKLRDFHITLFQIALNLESISNIRFFCWL